MNLEGRICLVTGAGGFIGSHLAEHLVGLGAVTRALVHYNALGSRGWLDTSEQAGEIEFFAADLMDRDSLGPAFDGVDVVFHLGALIPIPYSYRAPESFLRTNALGTMNVLTLARDAGVGRVVHTSTSEVYGTAREVPISESHPLQAQSPYAASKIAADKVAEAMHLSFGVPVVTLRPFNTFGPRQSARAVIPTIITQMLDGGPVRLGSLDPTRDFTFVADTVRAFTLAATAPDAVGETLNVGSGKDVSIGDLARMVLEIAGVDCEVLQEQERLRPEDSEVERLRADAGKAAREIGWAPSVPLREGLSRTIDWFRVHLHRYRPGDYVV